MPLWIAGAALVGAGAGIYGANRSSDAIGDAGDASAAFQNRALDTQIALARPQLEVGTGALGILANLYGLPAPEQIDFGGLGGGGLGGRNRQFGGAAGFQEATQGLSPIAGATWKGRPVFTDGSGGLYTSRGRDATVGSAGVEFLGQAGEGDAGTKFAGARVKAGQGILDYRNGQFYAGRGDRAPQINVATPTPIEQPTQQGGAAPGTPSTGGLNLEDLVANNPLIQFNRQQGEQAIDRGAAARGLNQSGGTLQDLSTFNQQLSGAGVQDFVLNPLFQLAGFGSQGSAMASNAVGSNANNLSNIAMNTGNARASAFQNAGNIAGNTISDLGAAYFNRNRSIPSTGGFLFNSQTGQELQGPPRPGG